MALYTPFAYVVPPAELEVVRIVWDRATATAGEVRAALLPARQLTYVTVNTTMDRLARKACCGASHGARSPATPTRRCSHAPSC